MWHAWQRREMLEHVWLKNLSHLGDLDIHEKIIIK
jgi:hypothetical protein